MISRIVLVLLGSMIPSLALASGGGAGESVHLSHTTQVVATVLFAMAVIHTFMVGRFNRLARRFPEGSIGENVLHFLGEVEVVFGLWAAVLCGAIMILEGFDHSIAYIDSRNYTEPAFVFVIMTMAATRPILHVANKIVGFVASILPFSSNISFFFVALVVGPLLGSLITEPGAMTITALVLLQRYYERGISKKLMYATIGVLFVNISIGGALTHFAAPPVLMVAGTWGWGISFMIANFGWKAAVACVINAAAITVIFRKELQGLDEFVEEENKDLMPLPWLLILIHMVFMATVVMTAHHMKVFLGIFLFFMGIVQVTQEYQEDLKLKGGLLVGFFLAGLVTLGGLQQWWLQPILSNLGDLSLFIGATGLTAITDNAALTYLASLVEGLSDSSKYSVVAGALVGGGLTVIANAPNPAGFQILQKAFPDGAIMPLGLLLAAIPPTLVGMVCFWWLPSL